MRKLLVYLHGLRFDKTENLEFQNKLAKELNADLLSIDAPFSSGRKRGGLGWWHINRNSETNILENVFDEKIIESENMVKETILKELEKPNRTWGDVILCGRSQGALLSLMVGLKSEEECAAIIPIAGFVSKKVLNDNIKSNPKIIWIEVENDAILNDYMKKTYGILEAQGVKLDVFIDKDSDHDNLNESIVEIIKKEL